MVYIISTIFILIAIIYVAMAGFSRISCDKIDEGEWFGLYWMFGIIILLATFYINYMHSIDTIIDISHTVDNSKWFASCSIIGLAILLAIITIGCTHLNHIIFSPTDIRDWFAFYRAIELSILAMISTVSLIYLTSIAFNIGYK